MWGVSKIMFEFFAELCAILGSKSNAEPNVTYNSEDTGAVPRGEQLVNLNILR